MKNLFKYHTVKVLVLGATIVLFINGLREPGDPNIYHWSLAVLSVFQVRGILWEEMYRQAMVEQNKILNKDK